MFDIKFEFSLEKLINALAFFATSGIHDLTKLKAAKLLYFIDKEHLLSYGAPILGDVYWCMDYGPVPSLAYIEMSEAMDRPEVPLASCGDFHAFDSVLRVVKAGMFRKEQHPRFEARSGTYDSTVVFSPSEIKVLTNVVKKYGSKSAFDLVELTHLEPTWKIPNQNRLPHGRAPIPYELFFEGAPQESQRFLAKLKAEQCGEVIELASDSEFSTFAGEMLTYNSQPDFELDSDQKKRFARQ
jgi:uncharacterized phage-associated protein